MYFCVRTKKLVEIYEKPNHDSHSHYEAAAVPQVQCPKSSAPAPLPFLDHLHTGLGPCSNPESIVQCDIFGKGMSATA